MYAVLFFCCFYYNAAKKQHSACWTKKCKKSISNIFYWANWTEHTKYTDRKRMTVTFKVQFFTDILSITQKSQVRYCSLLWCVYCWYNDKKKIYWAALTGVTHLLRLYYRLKLHVCVPLWVTEGFCHRYRAQQLGFNQPASAAIFAHIWISQELGGVRHCQDGDGWELPHQASQLFRIKCILYTVYGWNMMQRRIMSTAKGEPAVKH